MAECLAEALRARALLCSRFGLVPCSFGVPLARCEEFPGLQQHPYSDRARFEILGTT